ncbi:MAG: Sec-dependent nitrous-oxide reductase, partial [Bacteroidetes bacterium]|nr:Sec-dependent nitrous-oxide reductase [Bacteroidota bacterium]
MKNLTLKRTGLVLGVFLFSAILWVGCPGRKDLNSDAASKVYVAPGQHDEFYAFLSGGFSGQIAAYGLPSGRLLRVVPVFSVNPENGYGYSEETKDMLMTSNGFIPWDDSHHPELSMTEGVPDGRWLFINANNTPRIARLDLATFRTAEIIEIPNSGGSHASPFTSFNTEYVVSATRFSVPIPQKDVPISSFKENFKGTLSFISVGKEGEMDLAFQILVPGFDFDLSHAGKGPSDGWYFFSCYNSEQAYTLLEANASQNDKDFIMAVNWKKAEEYLKAGKAKEWKSEYYHNYWNEKTQSAVAEKRTKVMMLDPKDCPDMIYLMPCPKSPHGCDVDPSGQYIIGSGKLAPFIPVFSFEKMQKAIAEKAYDGEVETIPILKYDQVMVAEVGDVDKESGSRQSGLGPLHTEFDDKGFAYTSHFITSEVVKWKVGTWEIVDRIPTYYSIGHLMIPGGDSKKPWGKYLVAMNKITKDR